MGPSTPATGILNEVEDGLELVEKTQRTKMQQRAEHLGCSPDAAVPTGASLGQSLPRSSPYFDRLKKMRGFKKITSGVS